MQLKYNERIRNNKINSTQLFSLNATNVGASKSKCRSDVVRATPQKCYGVYNRQVLSGNNGLAAKVIDISSSYLPTITNVYKRAPGFQSNQHTANIRSKAIRCMYFDDSCNAVEEKDPDCKNNCRKSYNITQDLGYLSAKDYMEKKLALRSGSKINSTEYESTVMKNIHGHCP